MHVRNGAANEHVDGLTRVSRAEDADGLQRGGVVVGKVANELLISLVPYSSKQGPWSAYCYPCR